MTLELDDLPFEPDDTAEQRIVVIEREPRKCRHPRDQRYPTVDGWECRVMGCGHTASRANIRRGKASRSRGNAAELTAAKRVGGRKMGPLGLPWDVEMPGYARIQVRKYMTPEGLRKIAAELARIGSGAEMPGYIWIEPGRGGEKLIVFRLDDFAERHGVKAE